MNKAITYRTTVLVIFLLTVGFSAPSIKRTKPSVTFFTTDNLGNIFVARSDNSLERYNSWGAIQTVANFKLYGQLSYLDVSNPFELYAFYEDQQIVLLLDNMFNVQAELVLGDITNSEISAIARSFDNGLWYYDLSKSKLVRTSKSLETQFESMPFATWAVNDWKPSQIIDNEVHVFVLDASFGISIFDVFGNYYKTIDLPGLKGFQVDNERIFYAQGGHYLAYNFKRFTTDTLATIPAGKPIRKVNNQLYIWQNDSLSKIGLKPWRD